MAVVDDATLTFVVPIKSRRGNGTGSDYSNPWNPATASDDVRTKFVEYFGQGADVAGTPQAWGSRAKFFAKTTDDAAQCGSSGAFLVDTGTPFTQAQPVTGWEGDAVVQGGNTASGKVVGVVGVAEAQNTGQITGVAAHFYAPAKAAKDAGTLVAFAAAFYAEDPATGSAGTITDKASFYGKARIQSETSVVIGVTQAAITSGQKVTPLVVVGKSGTGQPVVRFTKASGSTDDIIDICDSGNNPIFIINQAGQMIFKVGNTAHSMGSAAGPCLAIGNITTPPSTNYALGGHLYVDAGALKYRGASGTVTTLGVA